MSQAFPGAFAGPGSRRGPSLDLDFLRGSLDSRITFSRGGTTGTYFDANGVMQVAAADAPRFDHDPVTHAPLGLLIEEQRTNLLQNSQAFGATTGAVWGSLSASVGAAVASPDGGTNAQTITGSTGSARIYQASGIAYGTGTFTGSVWLRAVTPTTARIGLGSAAIGELATDSVSVTTAWQRFTVTATGTSADTGNAQFSVYASDGTNGTTIEAFGAQLEQANGASSYVPTSTSPATRSGDVAYLPVGPWVSYTASSVGCSGIPTVPSDGLGFGAAITDGTFTNRVQIGRNIGSGNFEVHAAPSAANILSVPLPQTLGTTFGMAGVWGAALDPAAFMDGTLSAQPLVVNPTTLSRFDIGNLLGGYQFNGCLRRIRYWPRALSAQELQQVTT